MADIDILLSPTPIPGDYETDYYDDESDDYDFDSDHHYADQDSDHAHSPDPDVYDNNRDLDLDEDLLPVNLLGPLPGSPSSQSDQYDNETDSDGQSSNASADDPSELDVQLDVGFRGFHFAPNLPRLFDQGVGRLPEIHPHHLPNVPFPHLPGFHFDLPDEDFDLEDYEDEVDEFDEFEEEDDDDDGLFVGDYSSEGEEIEEEDGDEEEDDYPNNRRAADFLLRQIVPDIQLNLPRLQPLRVGSPARDQVRGRRLSPPARMDHARDFLPPNRRARDELVGFEMRVGAILQPQNQPFRPHVDFVDLTGDDEEAGAPASQPQSQNARRQRSQHRENAPRLNRSDSSYIGNQPVIELSSDSSDDDVLMMGQQRLQNAAAARRRLIRDEPREALLRHAEPVQVPRLPPGQQAQQAQQAQQGQQPHQAPRPHHHHRRHHHPHQHQPQAQPQARPMFPLVDFIPHIQGFRENLGNWGNIFGINAGAPAHDEELQIMGVGVRPDANPHVPQQLNYNHHQFPNPNLGDPRKPQHEPPPKASEGFTRDTGEDKVIICPSCEEELAYDPDEEEPPAKKARTRKDKAEHHFWAVKACGHVYCKRCYENRKPTGRNPPPVGFKFGHQDHRKIGCAVEGCDTDVSAKTAWVGLFL